MVNWFHSLFGFSEGNYQDTQKHFQVSKDSHGNMFLNSIPNQQTYQIGKFSTPNIQELKNQVKEVTKSKNVPRGKLSYQTKVTGDIFNQHYLSPGGLFQAASQFNCLEFVHPNIIPEHGIQGYQDDHTQGPACALATVPGTIYRNYLVPVNGHNGQNRQHQLNNLDAVQSYLKTKFEDSFITVKNGYSDSTTSQLRRLNQLLDQDQKLSLEIKKRIKVGFHQHTQVVFKNRWEKVKSKKKFLVSQIYCSALAINYSKVKDTKLWEPLARIILEASYEATLLAGIINFSETGNTDIFLTQLGGGVFGNHSTWIANSIQKSINEVTKYQVPVHIINCFYSSSGLDNIFVFPDYSKRTPKKKKKSLLTKKKNH